MKKAMALKGSVMTAERARHMKAQLDTFKISLEQFAIRHKKEIQQDPAFRAKFHTMCASIGVDPLTSRKGVWADLLGVGDYYYELAVRIIEICVATRGINGGVLSLGELLGVLRTKRITYTEKISRDDVERAVSKLDVLGSGFRVVNLGHDLVVQSVPVELSVDHTKALSACGERGFTSASALQKATGWDTQRTANTLRFLLEHEIAWLDMQSAEPTYWILGLVAGSTSQS